jgi:2-acylglycerol O-acyltransferase 2
MAKDDASYYMLDVAQLPDELYRDDVPVSKWLECCETADAKGFPKNSMSKLSPLETHVELERLIGITLYMLMNMLPFIVPPWLIMLFMGFFVAKVFAVYLLILVSCEFLYYVLYPPRKNKAGREQQYMYTERNSTKYISMRCVWPKSLHPPACEETPLIYCMAPHGVAPLGITAYPLYSKLFNSRLNHPTAAPLVMQLPLVGGLLKVLSYIPAKAKTMKDVLAKKGENVSVILDGVAGMFQQDENVEKCWLMKRKGICKISLQTGCPIVPVYGFGHSTLWSVVVDPFGILEKLSIKMDVSICPFYGRFFWPIGPPRRQACLVAFGEPITCEAIPEPTEAQILEHHAKMIEGFRAVFDKHKDSYGWGHKSIVFI